MGIKNVPDGNYIMPVYYWYLVVYFPLWGNPAGFRRGNQKKENNQVLTIA